MIARDYFSKRFLLQAALLFAAYYLTAKLGFRIQAVAHVVTEVWAPTGISLAALMLFGRRLWPVVFAAAFVANITSGVSWPAGVGIAAGNTLEAYVGAYLLQTYVGMNTALLRLRDVAGLIFAGAFFSTCLSASIGVASLWAGAHIPAGGIFRTWKLWWLGDMVSNLTVAPFLLAWGTRPWKSIRSRLRWAEAAGLVSAIIFANVLAFTPLSDAFLPTASKGYIVFPPLVWAALRFGPRGVTFGLLLTVCLSNTGAILGWSPFIGNSITASLTNLQVFLGVEAITALVLAAVACEGAQAEQALRESEGRFRMAADSAPVMLWMSGPDKLVNYFNHSWLAFTGRTAEQEMGDGRVQGVHPEDLDGFLKIYHAAFAAREPFQMEYRLRRYDGEYRWIADHGTPRFDSAHQFIGYIGTCLDVHDHKTGEQALENKVERRTQQLASLNRELEAFSYSVSHDLRAPLRAIDGFSMEIMENQNIQLDHRARADLQRVRGAAQRMAQLIDDLLNFSRLSRSEIRKEKVDLSAIAKLTIEDLRKRFPERSVEFKAAPHLQATGDGHLLRIVLENLLGNAWKFTSRTAAPVIEFGVTQEGGKRAYFVRDNGAGFNMQYAEKLFGVFQRLHTEKEFPGTGIGLATVQRIIHRHGGEIWAQAAPGEGATFFFSLQSSS